MMKKKFTSDFVFKDNFLWINAKLRSLHWYTSYRMFYNAYTYFINRVNDESEKSNPKNSQYLLLDKNDVSKKLQGELMGVVKSVVELNNGRIAITTESGEKLELKVSDRLFILLYIYSNMLLLVVLRYFCKRVDKGYQNDDINSRGSSF